MPLFCVVSIKKNWKEIFINENIFLWFLFKILDDHFLWNIIWFGIFRVGGLLSENHVIIKNWFSDWTIDISYWFGYIFLYRLLSNSSHFLIEAKIIHKLNYTTVLGGWGSEIGEALKEISKKHRKRGVKKVNFSCDIICGWPLK